MQGGIIKHGGKWYYFFHEVFIDGKIERVERIGGDTKDEALSALMEALNESGKCGAVPDESDISISDYYDYWYKSDKKNLRIITKEDFDKILERFPSGSSFYIPLMLGFHTGMRAAEICGLTWDCVDLENNLIKVEKALVFQNKQWILGSLKTQSSRRSIEVDNTLRDILKNHKKLQDEDKLKFDEKGINNFVCTNKSGAHLNPTSLKYLNSIINNELNINFNFHSLRLTYAAVLVEAGVVSKEIE